MTAAAPLLALIRHGETDWNHARRIQGRTEVPLNATGRLQARAAAKLLSTTGPWASVHASPLGRAVETAEIIAGQLTLTAPAIHEALLERNFGDAEGLLVSESETRWPGLRDVPAAEPLDTVAERSAGAIATLAESHPRGVVVAHGAMLRAGLSYLTGTEVPRIPNGEIWLLSRAETGYTVARLG